MEDPDIICFLNSHWFSSGRGAAPITVLGKGMMTLEQLRIELLDSVKNCQHPDSVAQLFATAECRLRANHIGEQSRRAFWEAVDTDLVVVAQEASVILERQAALSLRTTLGAARAALDTYRVVATNQTTHSVSD
jgi:hypothetical protein